MKKKNNNFMNIRNYRVTNREEKNRMKKNNNKIMAITIIVIFLLIVLIGILATKNIGKTSSERAYEKSTSSLNKLLKNINVENVTPVKGNVTLDKASVADELPDISKYPLSVEGNGDITIEIFSSPEKAGEGTDGWINEVAKNFNKEKYNINGKTVAVSIRSVASGTAVDYISSQKYTPTAFTPSNELWGKMIEASNVDINLENDKLVENTAGILLSKETYDKIQSKYGEVNLNSVVQATINGEITMGYTNPYSSSTGINFLVSALAYFDANDPLSDEAVKGFEAFQANVPFVSYTTLQMREAAEKGSLEAFILEYQSYQNDNSLKDYTFVPFGVAHNNPIYSIGNLTEEQFKTLDMFINYCLNTKSQSLATQYGFGSYNGYTSNVQNYSGQILLQAQDLWKEQKDLGKPTIAVFVSDVSGSMSGVPLNNLKKSLINASQYINNNNYIGLVSYSTNVFINLPIAKFDLNQRAYFNGSVQNLSASGNTCTFDAVLVALDMIQKQKEQVPDAKTMLFVLSDGATNKGNSLEDISSIVQGLEVPIYTIGYNADIDALTKISSINEAASINADSDDVVYQLKSLFNSNL